MATDSTLPVRRAILTAMKADADLTALVAATSIYRQSAPASPTWPFTRYGGPTTVPFRAACVDGCIITFALHGFGKPRYEAGARVEEAEDHTARIGAAINKALDGKKLDLGEGVTGKVRWTGGELLQDGAEADAYHTIQRFRVRVLS